MTKRRFFVITALIITLLVTACGTGSQSVRKSHSTMGTPREFSEILEFELKDGFSSLSLKLEFKVDEGTVDWVVLDPDGNQKWFGQLEKGEKLKETRSFELINGSWTVAVRSDHIAGEILMEWVGKK